jgi:hypothetical protein
VVGALHALPDLPGPAHPHAPAYAHLPTLYIAYTISHLHPRPTATRYIWHVKSSIKVKVKVKTYTIGVNG